MTNASRDARKSMILGVALAMFIAAATTGASAQTSKLQNHRLAVRAHVVEEVYLAGRVAHVVGINEVVTDWTPAVLRSHRLVDLDAVELQIGAVAFRARLMYVDSYARVQADSEGVIDTGADAVMLLDDARDEVTIVGDSGALVPWTDAGAGTNLSLSATWFKGDR